MRKRNIIFCLFLILSILSLKAQSQSVSEILSQYADRYAKFTNDYPQERVYVHFDNTSYYKGEYIWYKANVVRGDNFHATPLSRILYVELVSPIGYPVETQKLIIENGQAHGSFLLKDTLNAGFYEVRAYTSWMLNFTPGDHHGWSRFVNKEMRDKYGDRFQNFLKGNAGIFSRVFPVYDKADNGKYGVKTMIQPPKITSNLTETPADKLKVSFYPESGNLVTGVSTRIAFEARDANGKFFNVSGAMIQHGDTIGQFRSLYSGRGVFIAVPDSDDEENDIFKGLKLKIRYNGEDYTFRLPKAERKGYVVNVDNSHNHVRFSVSRNDRTKGEMLGLMISCRGHVEYFDSVDLRNELSYHGLISRKDLPTGVNIFTLYNGEGDVIAQREVFINNHDQDNIDIVCSQPLKDEYKPYEKISFNLQVTDSTNHVYPHKETFSLAVTDSTYHEESFYHGNVMTDLLLSSEIKGFIPYPSYYFEKDDGEHQQALDLLMMVQGWTRYDFKQMAVDTVFTPQFKIERGLTFCGRIYNSSYQSDNTYITEKIGSEVFDKEKSELSGGYGDFVTWKKLIKEIYLTSEITLGDSILYGEALTKDGGNFTLNIPKFYGKSNIFLMMNKKSLEVMGEEKSGITGHLLSETARRQPFLENYYVLVPINAYPPLAKPYDIYETLLPDENSDNEFKNIVRPFILNKTNKNLQYDPVTHSYIIRNVVKKGRRKWKKMDFSKPVLVIDMRDLMTYLSNVEGRISSFNTSFFRLFGSSPITMFPALYGLSGSMQMYINNYDLVNGYLVKGSHYKEAYGSVKNLPKGMEFLPSSENFTRLCLYADVRNRELMYKHGLYNERIEVGPTSLLNSPLTIKLNFLTENIIAPGSVNLKFMGNRMVIQGISLPDEFYSPDYSRMALPKNKDYRRTIYWNPNVTTDENGLAHIEFYNNSFSKQFVISAEGITKDGVPIVYKDK